MKTIFIILMLVIMLAVGVLVTIGLFLIVQAILPKSRKADECNECSYFDKGECTYWEKTIPPGEGVKCNCFKVK